MARPLRFAQVHFFYPAYLDQFYARHPELASAGYREQIRALLADGFSGTHMLGPHLEGLGYDCELIIANCRQTQARWLVEHGLAGRTFASPMEQLALQLGTLGADVVYLTDPVHFHAGLIATLAPRPRLILGWRAAHVPQAVSWAGYDVLLSCLSGMRALALERGARAAEHFAPGFPDQVAATLPFPAQKDVDITFLGHFLTGVHPERNALLETVARVARATGATCRMHLSGDLEAVPEGLRPFLAPPLYGLDMYRALARSRICFDARGRIWLRDAHAKMVRDLAGNETANMRIFEATGCGSLLLTERRDNLAEFFTPGVEVAVYGDEQELAGQLEYYLAHPDEAERMGARARQRCLGEHAMSRRAGQLDALIRRHLAGGE